MPATRRTDGDSDDEHDRAVAVDDRWHGLGDALGHVLARDDLGEGSSRVRGAPRPASPGMPRLFEGRRCVEGGGRQPAVRPQRGELLRIEVTARVQCCQAAVRATSRCQVDDQAVGVRIALTFEQFFRDLSGIVRGDAVGIHALRGRDPVLNGQDESRSPHGASGRGDDATQDRLQILPGHEVAHGDLECLQPALQDLHLYFELLGSTSRLVGGRPRHAELALRRAEALTCLLDDECRLVAEQAGRHTQQSDRVLAVLADTARIPRLNRWLISHSVGPCSSPVSSTNGERLAAAGPMSA